MKKIEVKKYRFFKVVWLLCSDRWKKPLGDNWEDVFSVILEKWSPKTCLTKETGYQKLTQNRKNC